MSVSAGVADVAIAVREKLRGKIGQTKVQRYWPGKKPEWAPDEDADEEKPQEVQKEEEQPLKDDPRLRRLAESQRNREEAIARHREIRQAEIVSTREEEKAAPEVVAQDEEEDEDALDERRRKNRERILQKQKEEEMAMAAHEEDEDDEEEEDEEDEYETDSEEETGGMAMVKPIFVKKTERDTIAERERLEAEEIALHEAMKKKLEERRLESKHLVVEEIKKEEEMEKNKTIDANLADVDTDDETNEAEEYEAWKAREIARIKRERDEKEAVIKEKEEIEKLRNMTEEERKEWERKNPKEVNVPKKKWKFLQKYYHKGAFFQSGTDDSVMPGGDVVLKRDYSAPTGEDRLDKTILPKVMQVKHFGRSGRTKWTHLVAEDTTQWDSPWTYNDPLRAKYNTKMAGMNRPIQKPQGSKKLKRSWDAV